MAIDIRTFPKFHIYCDESSQTKHRYTVIGATACRASVAPHIAKTIDHIIAPFGGTSELKWGKLTRHTARMYNAVYTGVFQMIEANYMQYYSLVVDNNKVDHKSYNDGDHDLGFTKFLFTLVYKFSRIYRSDCRLYVFLDDRTTKHQPSTMKDALNARVRRDIPRGYDPYRQVDFCQSEQSRLIQATDILTGAIAYETNQHHVAAQAAAHKRDALQHVRACAGVHSLAIPTPFGSKGFDIWHLEFGRVGVRAPRPRRGHG